MQDQGPPPQDQMAQTYMALHDLSLGKYDVTVTSGPSYSTRRQEAAAEQMQFLQAFPQAAPVIGDIVAKNLDWPQADEIAERIAKATGQGDGQQGLPPDVQKQISDGVQLIQQQQQQIEQLKAQLGDKQAQTQVDAQKIQVDAQKTEVERRKAATAQFEAETNRFQAMTAAHPVARQDVMNRMYGPVSPQQ